MKNLTLRYSVTQFTHWASATGASSFATAYLLSKGIPSGVVGTMLALAGILSCLTQPFLASAADKSKSFLLTKMLLALSGVCALCFAVQLIPGLPLYAAGLCYIAGVWGADTMTPLLNALSVAYDQADYPINYGAARGIGAAASALSSLVLGHVLARFGTPWMLVFLVGFRLLSILTILTYPRIGKPAPAENGARESCSVAYFFAHYKWYCVSPAGILFLGMYHAMTENYLIAILGRLGGDSSHVGTALFIASMSGAPVIFFFSLIRKRSKDTRLLKIAALSFLVKAVLFYFAESITAIYLLQLLQITSYGFLGPVQVYYANEKVEQTDMVKGQAFITAAYALGCSAGNFAGGQLLGLGVDAILLAGIAMALLGTVIIFLTVNRSDLKDPA